jgi:hypothetical protein
MFRVKREVGLADSEAQFQYAAVLVWMPDGCEPTTQAFNNLTAKPEPFWLFSEAIEAAINNQRAGYKPWVKAGDGLFGLDDMKSLQATAKRIKDAYGT